MEDELIVVSDAVSVDLKEDWRRAIFPIWKLRQAQKRAEVERLRAELLNDPHTLLLLPCIREYLHKMSFVDSLGLDDCTRWCLGSLQRSRRKIFRECDKLLSNAKLHSLARRKFLKRCSEDRTFYYLVGLDILLRKISLTPKSSCISAVAKGVLRDMSGRISKIGVLNCVILRTLSNSKSHCDHEDSTSYAMVVAAVVVLLFCVCQYLVLFVDRGRGSRSYSSGSVDFRDVFVSIVLFRGAYVWIKFRQAAASQASLKRKSCESQDHVPGVYARAVKDKSGIITHYKYEPRFKPRREKSDSGVTLQFSRLSLGEYGTPGEAKIVLQIAGFYYGAKDAVDRVELEDGSFFVIPAMDEHEKRLTGLSKAKWVTERAKKLFEELHPESAVRSRKQSRTSNAAVELDVADRLGSCHEPIPALECRGVGHDVPQMENDAPEPYHHDNSSGYDGEVPISAPDQQMFDELRSGSVNILSQAESSCVDLVAVSEILGDPIPRRSYNGAAQEFVGIPNPNCAQGWKSLGAVRDNCTVTNVFEPAERDHHPLVSGRKELLEGYATRVADLQHHQLKYGVTISELRRDIEQLRAEKRQADVMISELRRENEHLRAAKAQEEAAAAKSLVGPWLADFVFDFQP